MPKAPHPSPTSLHWKGFPSPDETEKEATLRELIAHAKLCVNEDKKKEGKHVAELLEMLERIDKAKSEIIFSSNVGNNEVQNAFIRATEAIKKYVEICLKTSPLINEKKTGISLNRATPLSVKCGEVIDKNI